MPVASRRLAGGRRLADATRASGGAGGMRFRLASLRDTESRRLEYLEAALAFAPDRADLHLARADALMQRWQGNRTSQQMFCTSALIATGPVPNLPAAFWLAQPAPLGWEAQPLLLQAHWHIAQAHRLSPLDLVGLEKASLLARLKGDGDGTDRALARLLRLSPSEPRAWFWAGQQSSSMAIAPKCADAGGKRCSDRADSCP